MGSRAAKLVSSGTVRHDGSSVYIRVDKHGRNIGILVIDATDQQFRYTIGPHPTEIGRVAMSQEER